MSVLIISQEDQVKIKAAIVLARANPTPFEALAGIGAADAGGKPFNEKQAKQLDEVWKKYPSQSFQFGTVRVAFSFERQPAGLFRHLSVSVDKEKKVPNYEVVKMLALEFGFSAFPPTRAYRVWSEEYEPRRYAVNVIELEEPSDVGHA